MADRHPDTGQFVPAATYTAKQIRNGAVASSESSTDCTSDDARQSDAEFAQLREQAQAKILARPRQPDIGNSPS